MSRFPPKLTGPARILMGAGVVWALAIAPVALALEPVTLQGMRDAAQTALAQERRWWSAGLALLLVIALVATLLAVGLLRLNRRQRHDTAAREQAVAKLLESESKFRFIAENSGDVIWMMDLASQRFSYVSPSVYRLRGYTVDEAMGQPVDAGLTPSSAERVKTIIAHAVDRWQAGERVDTLQTHELDQLHKDGHLVKTEVVTTLHANAQGTPIAMIGVTRDITARKRDEEEIRQLAFYDTLTHLPNRRLLLDRMPQLLARAKREQTRLALLFIDLDEFKPINDALGHVVGDWLLRAVADQIQGCLRESDTAARIGGDEFVVLLPDLQAPGDALAAAEKIRQALEQPFVTTNGTSLRVSSSIGVAIYPDHGESEQALLQRGDEAMYRAKEAGRNRVELCAPHAQTPVVEEMGSPEQSFIRLAWKDAFASGNPSIDEDHRELFRLANVMLSRATARLESPAAFHVALDALLAHLLEHFAQEEALLEARGYAHAADHARQHQVLIARARALRLQAGDGGPAVDELVEFLAAKVVAGHMLQEDRVFFDLWAEPQRRAPDGQKPPPLGQSEKE